mgnify:FL=1
MQIKILGGGCAKCDMLEKATREAAANTGIEAEFIKVKDFADIMAFGVMTTPALVIDDEVKFAGRLPKVAELEEILKGASASDGGCGCGNCTC